ncbi:LacI family DNA-binding transcriptional regulator [Arsenicitalea aurantiaca]|nr:LacI family DNA-binding transcriptional regulator [Arsenicitalea aurantiaca]
MKKPPSERARSANVTIRDVAAELDLSITTISRALNGYSDVGEATRERVAEAAARMGYRPNRNAQRLVTRRTRNIGWVQPDNERKFLDPHFVEVMAGVLRGARAGHYDIVLTSELAEGEVAAYERYVAENGVDGFILDLPREDDPRIAFLLSTGHPFVVHGREARAGRYGWVDVDNYGNFYKLARLMIANGRRRVAFINGDERYTYALHRRMGVVDAIADAGLPPDTLRLHNGVHPMGEAGYRLTELALADPDIDAILYSSILMAIEGQAAIRAVRGENHAIAVGTMDDRLAYVDLTPHAGRMTRVRSSLREAGRALVEELVRRCEDHIAPRGTLMASEFVLAEGMDGASLALPLPVETGARRPPV